MADLVNARGRIGKCRVRISQSGAATAATPSAQSIGSFRSVAEVSKLEPHAEISRAAKGDHSLQFIAALSSHANLPVLQRGLHFERLLLDRLDDLLGLVAFEPLLDCEFLRRVAER